MWRRGRPIGGGGRGGVAAGAASHQCRAGNIPFGCVAKFRGTSSRQSIFDPHTPTNNSVGGRTPLNATRNATRNANVNPNLKSHAVRSTLNSPSVAGALRNRSALRDPNGRAHITSIAATAGWHNGRDGGNGWWRHGNGGYGWVGPLFWPFAYYDIYDYAMWGYGYDDLFWDYGYGDIYAGIFAPYGYDDLTGYLPQFASGTRALRQPAPASGAPPHRPISWRKCAARTAATSPACRSIKLSKRSSRPRTKRRA